MLVAEMVFTPGGDVAGLVLPGMSALVQSVASVPDPKVLVEYSGGAGVNVCRAASLVAYLACRCLDGAQLDFAISAEDSSNAPAERAECLQAALSLNWPRAGGVIIPWRLPADVRTLDADAGWPAARKCFVDSRGVRAGRHLVTCIGDGRTRCAPGTLVVDGYSDEVAECFAREWQGAPPEPAGPLWATFRIEHNHMAVLDRVELRIRTRPGGDGCGVLPTNACELDWSPEPRPAQ